jgi:hypothetical protein
MCALAQSLGARLWEDAPTVFLVLKITAALVYLLSRPESERGNIDHA